MAVSALACSVIVRNSTIETHMPGGITAFENSSRNQTFCTDGTISRVGFMVEADARTFINHLATVGLVPSLPEAPSEIVLVIQGHGFAYPCDWLQVGLFDGRPCVWLAGMDRGDLFMPQTELNANIAAIGAEELRESFELIGRRAGGKVEVYRNKTTGELRYVGRPFHPVRKWWQFWKKLEHSPVDATDPDQVYRVACNLVLPYVQHQLSEAPLDSAARKQLQRGCEMLGRVLEVNPSNWTALWFLGTARRCLRELEPAYAAFQCAYALEKSNPDVGRELACICMALGKGEEAVRVSREVLDRNPQDAGLMANYALALLIAGKVSEAEAAIQNSLNLNPEDRITQNLAKHIASVRTYRLAIPDRWPPG